MEYVIGPAIAAVLGLNISLLTGRKIKADVKVLTDECLAKVEFVEEQLIELNSKVQAVETTVDVIDKQTLAKMVTTLRPASDAIKEIQAFVGLK